MVEVKKDKKTACYVIEKTDGEGFHHTLWVTEQELWDISVQARQILE